jgi:asparagine synthase (glutamine-hydrolysing)
VSGIVGKLSFDPDEPVALGWSGQDAHAPRPRSAATNEREDVRVVSDSAITNAPHLREHLEQRGHRFRDGDDSELLAHAYEEWDVRCVDRVRGPFACAIWDDRRRRLLLARDRIGTRPLYFALLSGRGVAFASEIQSLLADPAVGREWCPEAIDAYLALGYVPAPLTAYRRISKLEPAQRLVVEGRRLHVDQYWDLPSATTGATLDERVTVLDELLAKCAGSASRNPAYVRRAGAAEAGPPSRLRDGVQEGGPAMAPTRIGLLYSGSTTSSTLLATVPPSVEPVVTVDLEQDASELIRSDAAACHLGRIRELEVIRSDASALAVEFAAHCDGPNADPSAVAQCAMYRAARRHMEVALTAHGASVLWAGYARHRVERLELAVRAWLGGPIAAIGAQLARPLRGSVKGSRALSHLRLPRAHACVVKHAYGLWDEEHRRAVYTRRFAWQVREANPFSRHLELYDGHGSSDPLERALYVDARTCLPDGVLASATYAARAAGLELRFPFLDDELVTLAATTPSRFKQRAGTGMRVLRQLLARKVPRALMPPLRARPAPHLWVRAALTSMVPDVLFAPRFDGRGIVSRPALCRLWEEHRRGRHDHARRLWSLVMLELWFRTCVDGDAEAEPLEYAVLKAAA